MNPRTWKKFEMRTARDHGTERIASTVKSSADWDNGLFVAQCKMGQREPAYLVEWLRGITDCAARLVGRVGIVVWKPSGVGDGDALVILRYRDWVELHGKANGSSLDDGKAEADERDAKGGR